MSNFYYIRIWHILQRDISKNDLYFPSIFFIIRQSKKRKRQYGHSSHTALFISIFRKT